MKNSLFLIVIFAGFLLLPFSSPALPAPSSNDESLDQAITRITDPESLIAFMQKEFQFKTDKALFNQEDYWQKPVEFWGRKSGDCEDYALFAQYVLKKLGYEVYVVSFYDEFDSGHTVAFYQDHGVFNVIDTDQLLSHKTKTIEESVSRMYPDWTWGAIAGQRGSRGWLMQKIHPS